MYREELAKLIAPYSSGVGVEVGVHKGGTSQVLLRTYPRLTLWLVDGYLDHPDYPEHQQQANFATMHERTVFAGPRRHIVKLPSLEAVKREEIRHALFDFVFIDADHSYEAVKADLAAWWPRVKPGGLFCGHDYGKREYGVTQAVDEWHASAPDGLADRISDKANVVFGAHIWWVKKGES